MLAKILETVMLVCFGLSWPMSIMKSWKSRTAKGKSLGFLLIILAGYAAGLGKIAVTDGLGGFLTIPYGINVTLVSIDAILYLRNHRLDLLADAKNPQQEKPL